MIGLFLFNDLVVDHFVRVSLFFLDEFETISLKKVRLPSQAFSSKS